MWSFFRGKEAVVNDASVTRHWPAMATNACVEIAPPKEETESYSRVSDRSVTHPIKEEKRPSESLTGQWQINAYRRPQRPEIVVKSFVEWCVKAGYVGEFRWIDIWKLYQLTYCREVSERPLTPNYQNLFAEQLAKFCRRDFYREKLENGRVRFYRTYHIQPRGIEKMQHALNAA